MKGRRLQIGALVFAAAGAWVAGCYYTVEDLATTGGADAGGSGGSAVCVPACQDGKLCFNGTCELVCSGELDCNGVCVDTTTDVENCGSCGNACATGEVCDLGSCETDCSAGLTPCGASCFDLQIDPSHCGNCDTACTADQDCIAAVCAPSCESQLNQPVVDAWGNTWDSANRAAATFAAAEQSCADINGRLPLVSEASRVSQNTPAPLPNIVDAYVWTSVPRGKPEQWMVNLSWGGADNDPVTSSHEYRCMCPGDAQPGFSAGDCAGPLNNECFAMPPFRFDVVDRDALNKAAALHECVAKGGQLPSPARLAAAVRVGLPGGSGESTYVGDEESSTDSTTLTWDGVDPYWSPSSGNIGEWGRTGPRAFRCAGPSSAPGSHPVSIANGFVSQTGRVADGADRPAQTFKGALKTCWDAGGHLPSATELVELVVEGLPGGSGAFSQTTDHGNMWQTFGIRWNGVDKRYEYGTNILLDPKSTLRPFRCVYYPVDTAASAPEAASCSGGCTEIAQPSGAKMWIDNTDRAPVTAGEAVEACAALGAELTSLRDLLEAFHLFELSTTSTTTLRSFDIVDIQVDGGTSVMHLDLRPALALLDPEPAESYAVTTQGASVKYRCRWTNEVR